MNHPAVFLLMLEQRSLSLEDHTRLFVKIANLTHYLDYCLCTFYKTSLNSGCSVRLSGDVLGKILPPKLKLEPIESNQVRELATAPVMVDVSVGPVGLPVGLPVSISIIAGGSPVFTSSLRVLVSTTAPPKVEASTLELLATEVSLELFLCPDKATENFPELFICSDKATEVIPELYICFDTATKVTPMIPSPDPYHFPSHLETITRMDQLFVFKEVTKCLTVCFGIKPIKRFNVKDDTGNKVFRILEDSDHCGRQFYGSRRSFIMNVTDNSNQEVIRLVHPSVYCFNSHELKVQSPPGTPIGYVQQNWHFCLPELIVANEQGEPAFKIERPGCTCCSDQNFELVSLNGAAIGQSFGKISKPLPCSGPNFVLRFPSNLDVKMKATILGACMLIVNIV
ncbi:phospholipid scramblase 2-like [Garra rufa]|uniref:phospholipid scramblase 2-like n=1 Tax=Garra rufa TaxID=137080 RepID=UPI003CCEB3B1